MNKKLSWSSLLLISLCLFAFSSCNSDDEDSPSKPVIKLEELGSGHDSPNDKIGYAGSSMHIEGEIIAEGLIKQIEVEVHSETENYEFSQVYTDSKYVGVKNVIFHEHFDIPADVPAGLYHFHFTVIDQLGQTTTAESELTIKRNSDNLYHDH